MEASIDPQRHLPGALQGDDLIVQTQFLDEGEGCRTVGHEGVGALLDRPPIVVGGRDFAAEAVASLQDDDLGALLDALPRGGEPGDATADDRQPHSVALG